MTAAQWGQFFVLVIIAAFVASPFIGRWLRKRRQQSRSARCARLEKLVELSDEFDAAPTDKERAWIYRKAQSLGLAPEADEPFHLDDQDSPNWNNPEAKALRERGYKRINDPRPKPNPPHLPKAS